MTPEERAKKLADYAFRCWNPATMGHSGFYQKNEMEAEALKHIHEAEQAATERAAGIAEADAKTLNYYNYPQKDEGFIRGAEYAAKVIAKKIRGE